MQDRQAGAMGWSVSLPNGRAEYARIPKPILILASRFIGAAEAIGRSTSTSYPWDYSVSLSVTGFIFVQLSPKKPLSRLHI